MMEEPWTIQLSPIKKLPSRNKLIKLVPPKPVSKPEELPTASQVPITYAYDTLEPTTRKRTLADVIGDEQVHRIWAEPPSQAATVQSQAEMVSQKPGSTPCNAGLAAEPDDDALLNTSDFKDDFGDVKEKTITAKLSSRVVQW
ncbi:hypothetical protein G7K_4435-t1 [Saitoella complicata NRRL Y-17804]|uniref:Uncharacterized protein n=1 Tax=Saitoella complicata (strain BCRC 22490 / CBS 7301 / JCM 7358 / NBRC 10748 / NRRL Y-17804) TaxID=698492 RepID=A0A0E9NLL7_SAICN|nr:hypothetical protein G7K_4435-t1 [Saitoella complicata NRRL Y-17804]